MTFLGRRASTLSKHAIASSMAPELEQRRAAIDLDVDAIRRGRQRRVVARQRLLETAQLREYHAAGVERVGMRRICARTLSQGASAASNEPSSASALARLCSAPRLFGSMASAASKFVSASAWRPSAGQRQPEIVERIGTARLELERRLVACARLLVSLERAQRIAAIVQRVGIVRPFASARSQLCSASSAGRGSTAPRCDCSALRRSPARSRARRRRLPALRQAASATKALPRRLRAVTCCGRSVSTLSYSASASRCR